MAHRDGLLPVGMMTVPTTAAPPRLAADSLYRFFRAGEEETFALRGVGLRVEKGEIVAVTGPSGSGKTTLLSCLAGLDEPDGGTVHVAGERLSHQQEHLRSRLRARYIGVLFQSGNLLEHLTIRDNVRLVQRLSDSAGRPGAQELLREVGIAPRAGALPRQLSGGEAARAGLAVALANDPAVLLADEPTGQLDRETARQVMAVLLSAADTLGAAVLITTHDARVAGALDERWYMADGRVVHPGIPDRPDIHEQPEPPDRERESR
ncbi:MULTISPECIES: ABC transporter ATP-binding protein [unclassified Streptomyces]|uniref:ABC transporter ATP-binding protein n=2 Tax=unclassified Streptomyces TaxID=2593676 RepID=UPI00352D304B